MKKNGLDPKTRLALLAHAPEEKLTGGMKTVAGLLKTTFPQLEIFPLPDWSSQSRLSRLNLKFWFLNWWKNGFLYYKRLLKIHREKPFDLLFVYPFAGNFANAKQLGIPVIDIYCGCFAEFAGKTMKNRREAAFQRWVAGMLDKRSGIEKYCTTISEPVKNEIRQRYGHDCFVIPLGIDLNLFQPLGKEEARKQLGWPLEGRMGLFIGRNEFAKGWDILAQVAKTMPSVTFVALTPVPFKPETDNIVVWNKIAAREMALLYNAADFFLFPSRYESAALVVLEAMACNLPVILSAPVADVCLDDKTSLGPLQGFYVAQENRAEAYVELIQSCLRQNARAQTRDTIAKNRSLEIFGQRYETLVRKILDSRS